EPKLLPHFSPRQLEHAGNQMVGISSNLNSFGSGFITQCLRDFTQHTRRDASDADDRTRRFPNNVVSPSAELVEAALNGAEADHHQVGSSLQREIPQTNRGIRIVHREIDGWGPLLHLECVLRCSASTIS